MTRDPWRRVVGAESSVVARPPGCGTLWATGTRTSSRRCTA